MCGRFGKDRRILRADDYREVFKGATFRRGQKEFLLLARHNDRSFHRLGLAVAKKHVRLATQRNRIKRGAREAFRQMCSDEPGLDIIFLTRPGASAADKRVFIRDLPRQLQQLCRATRTEDDKAS